jgi:hypothetical protein
MDMKVVWEFNGIAFMDKDKDIYLQKIKFETFGRTARMEQFMAGICSSTNILMLSFEY